MVWHLITPEFPPAIGGVGDYAQQVATALAGQGDQVQVWSAGRAPAADDSPSSHASYLPNGFTPGALLRLGRTLNRHRTETRLIVQWVPHGFGYRSMNLPLCLWLWGRARLHHDDVSVMVHEPFLAFGEGTLKQQIVAAVHRVMAVLLLSAARRVWVSVPAWETALRPFALGRKLAMTWLPVPSNVTPVDDPAAVAGLKAALSGTGPNALIVGHFGTFGGPVARLLEERLNRLMESQDGTRFLLIGRGSTDFRARLLKAHPLAGEKIHATGALSNAGLSLHLQACDLLIQPYPDGVSTRRGSTMAGLCHGLPVLTTDGRFTESVWAQAGAVALAPAGDVEAFTAAARKLIESGELRRQLGARAISCYQNYFGLPRVVAALREAG